MTDDLIKLVYDTISLPETQFVAWKLLANNNTFVSTLRALIKEGEGEGRKVVPAFADHMSPKMKGCAAAPGSKSGSQGYYKGLFCGHCFGLMTPHHDARFVLHIYLTIIQRVVSGNV